MAADLPMQVRRVLTTHTDEGKAVVYAQLSLMTGLR